MSYTLEAFIGPAATLALQQPQLSAVPTGHPVALRQGLALLPVGYPEDLNTVLDVVEPFWKLPFTLFQQATEASALGPLGYVKIDMFGGYGDRRAVLWRQVAFGPATSASTACTEHLFKLLGVRAGWRFDRFEALGLGRHRHTEDWLGDA